MKIRSHTNPDLTSLGIILPIKVQPYIIAIHLEMTHTGPQPACPLVSIPSEIFSKGPSEGMVVGGNELALCLPTKPDGCSTRPQKCPPSTLPDWDIHAHAILTDRKQQTPTECLRHHQTFTPHAKMYVEHTRVCWSKPAILLEPSQTLKAASLSGCPLWQRGTC